jgi:hypothetical protein
MASFVKALRSEQAAFFDTNPLANHVLNVIARRARRTPDPLNGLQVGECFVGHKGLGLSEQQYRTVKKNLQKWGLVEFKKAERVTDRGTVAKLLNSDIYDINEIDPNGSLTEEQRKDNGSPTEGQRQTKNVIKKEGNKDKKEHLPAVAKPSVDFSVFNASDDQISEMKRIRRLNKGGAMSQRVVNSLAKEFHQALQMGHTFDGCLTEWETAGWKSMKADWVHNRIGGNNGSHQQASQQPGQIDHDDTSWGDSFLSEPADHSAGQRDIRSIESDLPRLEAIPPRHRR